VKNPIPQTRNSLGFTLVELSIVLVIIGLLIGGILVAQSMISTAKIANMVRQYSQYEVAVANFKTRYNQLPGDSNLMGNGFGNNNGVIDANETNVFWQDLSLGIGLKNSAGGNYVPLAFDGVSYSAVPNATNAPQFNINQESSSAPPLAHAPVLLPYTSGGINYFYYQEIAVGVQFDYTPSNGINTISALDALAFDKKLDDGLPGTGKVLAEPYGPDWSCTVLNTYNTSQGSNYVCSLMMQFGTETGLN